MNFYRAPFFLPYFFPQLLWKINTTAKEVYLTFDDGPVPGPTEFVLETLARSGIRATFFCIGDNVAKHPSVFWRVVSEGHAVGNHTFNHISGWSARTTEYRHNTERCSEEIRKITHTKPAMFRPPYGRITRDQIRSLNDYRIIMWDVLTHDYSKTAPEKCLKGSLAAVRPGSIIVFHDSLKAEKNLKYVLPRLIDDLGGKGFAFNGLA